VRTAKRVAEDYATALLCLLCVSWRNVGEDSCVSLFTRACGCVCVLASPGDPGGNMGVYVGEEQTNVYLGFEILANKIKYQNTVRILISSDNQL
jgi:hypothetical protein